MAIIERPRETLTRDTPTLDRAGLTKADLLAKSAIGDKLNVDAIKVGIAQKPSFVLEQFPPAGQEVPAGTSIDLVMLPKDNVRVDDVVVDARVKDAFAEQDVTKVREEIEGNSRLKEVFERGIEYDALNAEDKQIFNDYVREKGIATGETTPEDLKTLHDDLDILYKF